MNRKCQHCNGQGRVMRDDPDNKGQIASICPACHGNCFVTVECSGDSCSLPAHEHQED